MPTLEEGPRGGCAVVEVEDLGEEVLVDFAVGAEEVGDGVAEVAVVLLAAL